MKNYFQLPLGQDEQGQPIERGIKLNNRTIEYWYDATGEDPMQKFSDGEAIKNHKDIINMVEKIIYAGLRSNYASMKRPEDFTAEDVREWVKEMPYQETYNVFQHFIAFINPQSLALGEEGTDTQR